MFNLIIIFIMATKGQRIAKNSKKEKGAFKKSMSAQTEYQRERAAYKARKRKQGNYDN